MPKPKKKKVVLNSKKLTKPKKEVQKKFAFEVSLVIDNQEYKSKGNTFIEAVKGLDPGVVKTWGHLTLKSGGKTSYRRMRPFQVKRLLVDETTKIIIGKYMIALLK